MWIFLRFSHDTIVVAQDCRDHTHQGHTIFKGALEVLLLVTQCLVVML